MRGVCAAAAIVAFLGTLVSAPFALAPAAADEEFLASRTDRLHQRFVPEDVGELRVDVSVSPLERLPDPTPPLKPAEDASSDRSPQSPSIIPAISAPPRYAGGGSPAEWMAAAGIAESDWGYVDFIASKESGWNPNATNASSGACGLIQALPCSKVPGSGYDPVDNLRWANGYAVGRYGSWAGAYAFWTTNHWW